MLELNDLHVYKDVLVSGVDYDFSRNRHENIPHRLYADWADLIIKLAKAVFPSFAVPPFPEWLSFQTESIPSDGPYSANADYYMLDYVFFELKSEDGYGLKISFKDGRPGDDDSVNLETLGFNSGVSSYIAKGVESPRASIYVWHREDQTSEIAEIIARHQKSCQVKPVQKPAPDYSEKVEKCSLCGDLPEDLTINTGRDEYYLDPFYQLTRRVFSDSEGDFRRCPQCGTYFYWIDMPQMYGSGNNAEERFIRIPRKATPLLEKLFSPDAKDRIDPEIVDEFFESVKPEILLEVIGRYVCPVPRIFILFVPNLWRLLLRKNYSSIRDMLCDYVSEEPARAEEILGILRSVQAAGEQSPLSETLLHCFTVVQKKK